MVSLELAKKLKDAGLVWEPKEGDRLYYDDKLELLNKENLESARRLHNLTARHQEYQDMAPVFAPSLSQLLAEIEGRGYRSALVSNDMAKWPAKWNCDIVKPESFIDCLVYRVWADTPDDATALALLHILEVGIG